MISKPLCGLGMCALLATSFPALADETVSVRVKVADLDVQTSAGAATLRARINNAVNEICGSRHTPDLALRSTVDHCRAAVTPSFDGAMETILTERTKETRLARKIP